MNQLKPKIAEIDVVGIDTFSHFRPIAAAVLAAAVIYVAFNAYLTSIPGLDWLPVIQLHMEFNSYGFLLIFLPCTVCLYGLYRNTPYANPIIALSSLLLYSMVGIIYLVPLLFTCVTDYFVGAYLVRSKREWLRTTAFVASLCAQIGLLCVFKYYGWLTGEFNQLAAAWGIGLAIGQLSLPLPPGISFYTFHTISYTADIYQRKFKPLGNLVDYFTFVAFFPQLIAGPIARASEMLPQVTRRRPAVSQAQIEESIWLIAWGLFKKMCLADNFGLIVGQAITALHEPSPKAGIGYIFMYAFAAQIYCDFSSYTDMARGIARLFGIELPRNFLTPYFATSPSDFWRRWHISLSRWLRDYLYIPLGGEQNGRLKTLRNLGITMFLGGLWHGAGIGFIVWGMYHGLLLIAYRVFAIDEVLMRRFGGLGKFLCALIMFNLVCLGWIFFRAESRDILPLLTTLVTLPNPTNGVGLGVLLWGLALFGMPLLLTEVLGFRHGGEFVDLYRKWPWWCRSFAYVAIFYSIAFFARRDGNDFIYFQF
jgi:alginate O-acetyltransferase complex protein AlgI